jgi:glycosyltransferase involved in cell wall biosynthesis
LRGKHTAKDVSVVIPVLNEALTIGRVVRSIHEKLPEAEVVVVDGESSDNTVAEAKKAGAKVVLCSQRGYGLAIRRGIQSSSGEIIVMVDGDNTYDLSKLEELVFEARRGRVAVGCRFHSKPSGMSLVSFFGNWVITKLFGLVWGCNVADSQSGLKAFPKRLSGYLRESEMTFSTEVLIRAKEAGMQISELKLGDYKRRVVGSSSKLRVLRDGLKIVVFILEERLTRRENRVLP